MDARVETNMTFVDLSQHLACAVCGESSKWSACGIDVQNFAMPQVLRVALELWKTFQQTLKIGEDNQSACFSSE